LYLSVAGQYTGTQLLRRSQQSPTPPPRDADRPP
jgi:hypothetical protein